MDSVKYIGLDVHRDTISVAVVDQSGRLVMQSVIPTQASAILDCVSGIQGSLHVTLEEGTHSAWLYDLLVQRVKKLVVCNPRKNALLKSGSKSDAIDARKLAELLRAGMLSPVYHGENSALEVQHLARAYAMLTDDTTRTMMRLKAVFRSQAVVCTGRKLYGKRHHDDYLFHLLQYFLQVLLIFDSLFFALLLDSPHVGVRGIGTRTVMGQIPWRNASIGQLRSC